MRKSTRSKAVIAQAYSDHRRTLTAYAASILAGDFALAEEAVSEAFTDLLKRGEDLAGKKSVPAWLRTIVRNKSIDALRSGNGREIRLSEAVIGSLDDEAASPEERAIADNEAAWLRKSLGVLSIEQREMVELCYFEELSVREIARIAGCPEGTVKTRLFHARRKLREYASSEVSIDRKEYAA